MPLSYWIIGITWFLTILLTITIARRRSSSGESILAKLFQSNEDLDTTLGILLRGAVVFAVLAIVVVFFSMFHDDLDKSDVGMLAMHVIGMATNAITLVAVVNGGGDKKKDDDKSG